MYGVFEGSAKQKHGMYNVFEGSAEQKHCIYSVFDGSAEQIRSSDLWDSRDEVGDFKE